VYIDADEYFTISSDASSDAIKESQCLMKEPGSVLNAIKKYSDRISPHRKDIPSAWYEHFRKSPCTMISRILITAVESSDEDLSRDVPFFIDARQYQTMCFRYRATKQYDGTDRASDDLGLKHHGCFEHQA